MKNQVSPLSSRISITSNFIIMHPLFDAFIILVIIVNSVFLALDDPTSQTDTLSKVDNYFLGIYTAEMLLKIFGMGFILPRQSYLRDPWNVLDFAIVVTSYLTIALSSVNLNLRALRSLRVLRPLKTISNIEGLRIIVLTLLAALKPLLETLFILFFLFLIFAIAGLQLFAGSLKKRCFSLDGGIPLYNADGDDNNFQQYCSSDSDCGTVNSVEYICGKMIANPNYGSMNFDSIGSSLLFTFQTVTMEGWSDIMRDLQRTFSPLAPIFFIILILIGGFVLLNLTLAVIKAEFTANSHMSIKSRRLKKPTYDERLIKKLDENKIDVIHLIHKYQSGETLYRKYQFKKDQLLAIENSKRKLLRSKTSQITPAGSASRRRNAISSNTIIGDMTPFVKIKGVLGKLKALFTRKSKFGRFSKINSLNHDTRTELPASLQEFGTLNHLDRDTFRRKGRINSSKIVPHDSSKDSLTRNPSLDSLPGAKKKIFTPISQKFRSFFSKMNTLDHKVTMEPSSPSNIPEHQFTPRDSVDTAQNPENNTPDQSNVQVYKQTRGFGDLRIKITEANTPQKQGKSIDGNDAIEGSAANPLPSSVPSVIEEELSEASPSKTFDSGSAVTATRKSIFPTRVVGRRRQLRFGNSPIRPIKSEKVLVEQDNKVELINIAGIRNKRNAPVRPQQKLEEARETEQELLLEEQVDDLMDDDQWFLESLKAQENEGKNVGNRDKQRAALLKKINQIKGLTDFQRKSLLYQPPSVLRSSNKFSSAIGSEDFEGNFSRNSQSRKGGSVRNSSKGFLDDSDFLDRKKRNSNQNSRISRNSYGSYGSRGSGSRASQKSDKRALRAKKKATLKRGMTIREEDDAIKEENEEDEEIGAKRNEVQEEEIEDPIMSEEDVIELEEQEKHMVLDLRRLKAEPLYGKEYDSYSLNDVLPSKKLNEKKRQEEEDKRRLRENKMEIVHQVTIKEELAARERNQKKAEEMKKEMTALAMRFSEKAKEVRKQKKEEKAFDEEINAALENMRSKNNNSKSSPGGWTKKFAFRRASIKGPEISVSNRQLSNGTQKSNAKKIKTDPKEEEEELTQGQMKDFFFLLRKIQTPFNNEKENEESEEFQKKMKVFDFESDYTKIRVSIY